MALFFNGRLFVTPAVMSRVDDIAMFDRNPAVGNILAILGNSDAGQPKTPLRFGSPTEAAAVLRGGELLDMVQRAFSGTKETPGPSQVVAMRVQPASTASLSLVDGSATQVISLASQLHGSLANRTKVTIANGTASGKKITTALDSQIYQADNVGRLAATVRYSGAAASATVSVNASQVILSAPSSSVVATLDLNTFQTVADLVDRIALTPGWTAMVQDGSGQQPTAGALDFVAAADAKTADLPIRADLQAIVDWFNGLADPLVVATKAVGAGTVPANITGLFLTGASNGTTTVQEWADTLAALQLVDVQWIAAASADAAVHALIDAHCKFASDIQRRERRAVLGTALGTNDTTALALAKAINSDRTSLVHIGIYDFDPAGKLKLFAPYVTAALVAGGFSGVNPGTAMTNKALSAQGVERKLRSPTDTDQLLLGGVMPIEDTPTGIRVTHSITTWLTNTNFNRREASVGAAVDYVARAVREALEPLKGKKGGPAWLAEARSRTEACLTVLAIPEPQGIGVLVGDAKSPPFKNIRVSITGDVGAVEFQCSPVIPTNYIPVTIFAVPYSGSIAA